MTSKISQITKYPVYPVGRVGVPWNDDEKLQWQRSQTKVRDYFDYVLTDFLRLDNLDFFQYGSIDYRHVVADEGRFKGANYPLFCGRSKNWDPKKRLAVVTSFVHGYEPTTKAINLFMKKHYAEFCDSINFLFLPCVSPWGVEADNRWNPNAIDPNRQFDPKNPGCEEARLAMNCVFEHEKQTAGILVHIDLHTTPLIDNTKMEPMRFARDGVDSSSMVPDEIPNGVYLVQGEENAQPDFQKAMIDGVSKVVQIAPPDEKGEIIGCKVSQHGVIDIPTKKWHICGGFTNAPYSTTTEIFPEDCSNPKYPEGLPQEVCDEAQCAIIVSGVRYAVANPLPRLPDA